MKKRKNKQKLTYSTSEVLIPTLIISLFIIGLAILLLNVAFNSEYKKEEDLENDIWEEAFLEVEKNKVGVEFSPITTTEMEYDALRAECNSYIDSINEQAENDNNADANLKVDTVVNEKQFIDNSGEYSRVEHDDSEQSLAETGPIYFDDMLMIRYINTLGKLVVVIGMYDEMDNIVITRQDNLISTLSSINKLNKDDGSQEYTEGKENLEDHKSNSLSYLRDPTNERISEDEYKSELSKTLELMLKAYTDDEIRAAETMALNFFTLDGKKTVFGNRKEIKLDKSAEIETLYIEAGKSNSSKTYKDRIYTQLKITIDGDSTVVNIILKLNNNLRIYDIDII